LGKQGIGEVRADKACSTGDEYAHGASLSLAGAILLRSSSRIHAILR
jgi:hypothetical protein